MGRGKEGPKGRAEFFGLFETWIIDCVYPGGRVWMRMALSVFTWKWTTNWGRELENLYFSPQTGSSLYLSTREYFFSSSVSFKDSGCSWIQLAPRNRLLFCTNVLMDGHTQIDTAPFAHLSLECSPLWKRPVCNAMLTASGREESPGLLLPKDVQ